MIYLLAESDLVELLQDGFMEAFADAVGLGPAGLGARVVDILDGQVKLVLVVLAGAAVFSAAISQHA